MTEAQARKRLVDFTQRFDTNRDAAVGLGISHKTLADIIGGRRGVSAEIAEAIGLRLTVRTTRTYSEIA